MKILCVLKQFAEPKDNHPSIGAVQYYRQYLPHKLMGNVLNINSLKGLPEEYFNQFNLCQMSRENYNDAMTTAHNHNLPVIYDLDDYWLVDTQHLMWGKDGKAEKERAKNILSHLKRADLVTVTTELFADTVRPINPNVHVLPNGCTYLQEQYAHSGICDDDKPITIGWVGGIHHMVDIELLREPMLKLWSDKDLTGKFKVIMGGFEPTPTHIKMANILSSNRHPSVTEDNFQLLAPRDIFSFATMYDKIDICLAPLKDTRFNNHKSQLKIIEAGFKGKAVITSQVHPYTIDIIHDLNGMTIPQKKAHKLFYEYMRELILNRDKVRNLANNLTQLVTTKYSVEHINKKRYDLYSKTYN